MSNISAKGIEVLLIEDNEGDIVLTSDAFELFSQIINLNVCVSGEEALDYMYRRGQYKDTELKRPDVILLDINLPGIDGFDVLATLKSDPNFRAIPIIIFSTSKMDADVHKSYFLYANSHIAKPILVDDFIGVIKTINDYWADTVELPKTNPKVVQNGNDQSSSD